MNTLLELPAMKAPVSTKDVKKQLVDAIQSAIELAPKDSSGTARERKRLAAVKPINSRTSFHDSQDKGSVAFRIRKARAEESLADEIESQGCTRITFTAGRTTYTVWNNKQTLTEFLSRVKRAF